MATAVNGPVPAPTLRWREGDTVTLRVTNRLPRDLDPLAWDHLPADMDGVPGLSFDGIAPGETFIYRFAVRQSGTYWYHSHSGFQEQTGLYGPLSSRRARRAFPRTREHVVLLSDWTDAIPAHLCEAQEDERLLQLQRADGGTSYATAQRKGLQDTFANRRMWNRMRMDPSDLLT